MYLGIMHHIICFYYIIQKSLSTILKYFLLEVQVMFEML